MHTPHAYSGQASEGGLEMRQMKAHKRRKHLFLLLSTERVEMRQRRKIDAAIFINHIGLFNSMSSNIKM